MSVFNKRVILEYFLVTIGLVLLTLIIFNKLIPHFSSSIIGNGGDGVTFLWNFWWVKKSILELHQNPFASDYMFFPNIMDLRLHTLILAPALLTLPIQLLWGPIITLNIYVLTSFVLSGLGAYLLSKLYVKSRSTSFFGAIIYAFNAYVISHTYGHFNLTTTWPIPFTIYFLEKLYNTKKIRYAILSSFCYVFLVYSDLQYAVFTTTLVAIWLIWKALIVIKTKQSLFIFLKPLAVFIICIAIGLYPLLSLITSGLNNNLSRPGDEATEFYSPDLLAFIIPPQETITNSILANYNSQLAKVSFSGPEWAVYLGISVVFILPFIIVRALRRRESEYLFWIVTFSIFFTLGLGPELHFFANQNTGIILPFAYIHNLPFLNMTRVPVRIIVIAMLAISVLSAWTLSEINLPKTRYVIVSLLSIIYIGELLLLPVYIQKLEMPKAYAFLKEQQDLKNKDVSIIEFPLFFTDRVDILGKKETIFLYYQTAHERKMVNGYLSYTSPNFLKQYTNMPAMLFLAEPLNYGKPQQENLFALKYFLFNQAHVKYAIIHKNILRPVEYEYLSKFLQSDLHASKAYDDQDTIIYKLQ